MSIENIAGGGGDPGGEGQGTATVETPVKAVQLRLKRLSRLYVQRRFDEAHKVCREAIEHNKTNDLVRNNKAWNTLLVIFLRVAAQRASIARAEASQPVAEKSCVPEWEYVLQRLYDGLVENVPAEILCAGVLLLQEHGMHSTSQQAIETWLASQSELFYASIMNKSQPDMCQNYERIVELYCLHVLPHLNDYEAAKQFLEMNDVLCDQRRDSYLNTLEKIEARHRTSLQKAEARIAESAKPKSAPSPLREEGNKERTSKTPEILTANRVPETKLPTASTASSPDASSNPSVLPKTNINKPPSKDQPISRTISSLGSQLSKRIQHFIQSYPGLPPILIAAVLLALLARMLKSLFAGTMVGRGVSVVMDKLMSTARMGLNVQTI
ncbi:hypothetical protein DFS34DRAFT_603882 [Phlyctochytrium arcticum]|nr:hypothetical protein DFS34DRAFT_603882 [Phlyctochytrium arcticum]